MGELSARQRKRARERYYWDDVLWSELAQKKKREAQKLAAEDAWVEYYAGLAASEARDLEHIGSSA